MVGAYVLYVCMYTMGKGGAGRGGVGLRRRRVRSVYTLSLKGLMVCGCLVAVVCGIFVMGSCGARHLMYGRDAGLAGGRWMETCIL